jgi:hypothetical protein
MYQNSEIGDSDSDFLTRNHNFFPMIFRQKFAEFRNWKRKFRFRSPQRGVRFQWNSQPWKEAAEAEGETQAMLFAMLQEQHNKQIATMKANNKANMEAMMERINAIAATVGGGNKENSSPNSGTNKPAKGKRAKKPMHLCPNCKKMVVHLAEHCYELEVNKDKRYDGWVSSLSTASTA